MSQNHDTDSKTWCWPGTSVCLLVLATLFLFAYSGCNRSELEHGAGQQATLKEQDEQNRNLISQVVIAAEELEKHPDPEFLRGAVARLNSWLQKRPDPKDFSADADAGKLREKILALAALFAEANTINSGFFENAAVPASQDDGDKLIDRLEKIADMCRQLACDIPTDAFKNLARIADDFRSKLKSSKEYQFGNRLEMFRSVVTKFKLPEWYQFDTVARSLDDFATLLDTNENHFHRADADYFKQCVWLRNIANWAKGTKQDDLQIAQSLFDWTVKNILIVPAGIPGPAGSIKQSPWQTVLISQGTVLDRAIVFMELLRQVRLDSFLIQPAENVPDNFPVLVGVRIENNVFLFLPELGMPLPAKDGITLDNGLQFNKIATLDQAARDDSILRKLDLSPTETYPIKSTQLQKTVALVPVNPFVLSKRMAIMEREFSGNVYTVLATSFAAQKERIAKMQHVGEVRQSWNELAALCEQTLFPFEAATLTLPYVFSMKEGQSLETRAQIKSQAIQDDSTKKVSPLRDADAMSSPLWSGKVLYFKGNFTGENGAAHWLQQGRVSDRILKETASTLHEQVNAFLVQIAQEQAKEGKPLSRDELQAIGNEYVRSAQGTIMTKKYIKVAARFYLALVSLAAGNNETALSHLSDVSLIADMNGMWRSGTIYLLARIDETKGKDGLDKAIGIYSSDKGKYAYGNHLRAKWLTELLYPDGKKSEKESLNDKKPEKTSPQKAIDKKTSDSKQSKK